MSIEVGCFDAESRRKMADDIRRDAIDAEVGRCLRKHWVGQLTSHLPRIRTYSGDRRADVLRGAGYYERHVEGREFTPTVFQVVRSKGDVVAASYSEEGALDQAWRWWWEQVMRACWMWGPGNVTVNAAFAREREERA